MDPVRIEIFEGERFYKIPHQQSRILPSGEEGNISKDVVIGLASDHYIEFIARTKESNSSRAQEFCEQEINKAITALSLIYSSDIFDKLVFNGWLLGNTGIMSAWIKMANKLSINSGDIDKQLSTYYKLQQANDEIYERFVLMSRFYSKALLYDPGEEKFLFLWTILEIFPMKDTTNIKPVSIFLSEITGYSPEIIKVRLDIGKMYRIRSDLVHNGQFKVSLEEEGEFFSKMELIIESVLREMVGLSYDGRLDKYLV